MGSEMPILPFVSVEKIEEFLNRFENENGPRTIVANMRITENHPVAVLLNYAHPELGPWKVAGELHGAFCCDREGTEYSEGLNHEYWTLFLQDIAYEHTHSSYPWVYTSDIRHAVEAMKDPTSFLAENDFLRDREETTT